MRPTTRREGTTGFNWPQTSSPAFRTSGIPSTFTLQARIIQFHSTWIWVGDLQGLKPGQRGYAHSTGEEFYDAILLAYVGMGGMPNQPETLRLTHFGYLGNPGERLGQLLASGK